MPENGEELLQGVGGEGETPPAEPQPVVEVIEAPLSEQEKNFRAAFTDTLRSVRGGGHNKNLFHGYGPFAPGRAALANQIDERHLENMARAHGFDKIEDAAEQRHQMFRYLGQFLVANVERDHFSTIENNSNVSQKQDYLSDAYRMYRTNALLNIDGIAAEGQISGIAIICCECIGAEVPWTRIRDDKKHFEKLGRGENLDAKEQEAREKIQREIQEILPDIYNLLAHYRVQYWSGSPIFAKDVNAFNDSLNNTEPFTPLMEVMRRWGYDRSHNQDLNGIPVPSSWNEDPLGHQKEIAALVESWTILQQEAATKAVGILETDFKEKDETITVDRAAIARKLSEKDAKQPNKEREVALDREIEELRAARTSLQRIPVPGVSYGPEEQEIVRSIAAQGVFSSGYLGTLRALESLYATPLPEQSRLEALFDRAHAPKILRENAINELLKALAQGRMEEGQYLDGRVTQTMRTKDELLRQNDGLVSASHAVDREVRQDTEKIEAAEEALKKVTHSLEQAQILLRNLTEKLRQLEAEKKTNSVHA